MFYDDVYAESLSAVSCHGDAMLDTWTRALLDVVLIVLSDYFNIRHDYSRSTQEFYDTFVPELKLCLSSIGQYVRLAGYSGRMEVILGNLHERLDHTISVAFGEFWGRIEAVHAR